MNIPEKVEPPPLTKPLVDEKVITQTRRNEDVENTELAKQLDESIDTWIDAVAKKIRQETKKRPVNSNHLTDWAEILDHLCLIKMTTEDLIK